MKYNDVVKSGLKGISPKGMEYRVSGTSKIPNTKKWVNGEYKNEWYVYLVSKDNRRARLRFNHHDKLVENLPESKITKEIIEKDCNPEIEKLNKKLEKYL